MKGISRRRFLQISALAGGAMLLPMPVRWLGRGRALAFQQTPGLTKFRSALPNLGPAGIPVATKDTATFPGSDYYQLVAGEFRQVMHPDFTDPAKPAYIPGFTGSKLWGYADDVNNPNQRYLGGLIIASKDRPVRLRMRNGLVNNSHPVAVDQLPDLAMPGEAGKFNRIATHLHGGFVPWISDGGPFTWFDPNGNYGPSAKDGSGNVISIPDMGTPPSGCFDYYWPNQQSSRLMWFHDHAHNLTRVNAYVGLATGYLLVDDVMTKLINVKVIPDLSHTIPLIVQDKSFIGPGGNTQPGGVGDPGDLWYPSVYEEPPLPSFNPAGGGTGRWDRQPASPAQPLPLPSAVPEFFADTIVINGECYPSLTVERRHYRFLILNGSQARMFNLQLYYADNTGTDVALVPLKDSLGNTVLDPNNLPIMVPSTPLGPQMTQIGTEGGFLPFPVALNTKPKPVRFDNNPLSPTFGNATQFNLLLGGAERADVIIDFSNVPAGSKLILYNDAPAPFPGGDPRNDYFTGQPDWTSIGGTAGPTSKAMGPNTRTLMQINVVNRVGAADPPSMSLLQKLAAFQLPSMLCPLPPISILSKSTAVRTRYLTLNEDFDVHGRLIQMLGTNVTTGLAASPPSGLFVTDPVTFSRGYMDAVTENPKAGAIEVWKIVNRTGDTHPIHFHLVNVQLLSRQAIDIAGFNAKAASVPVGTAVDPTPFLVPNTLRGPDPNERGFKETVRMNPGEMVTVIMKFDLPKVPFQYPQSQFTGGYEYVWHCHILEHEEHDMMRPLVIQP
ncbi:MAG TPA: multicopper oxidase domain-containing protein [Geobacteraceae bacterium]